MGSADAIKLFDCRIGFMHECDEIIPLTLVDLLLLNARLFTARLGKIQFKCGIQCDFITAGQFPLEVFDECPDALLLRKNFDFFLESLFIEKSGRFGGTALADTAITFAVLRKIVMIFTGLTAAGFAFCHTHKDTFRIASL